MIFKMNADILSNNARVLKKAFHKNTRVTMAYFLKRNLGFSYGSTKAPFELIANMALSFNMLIRIV